MRVLTILIHIVIQQVRDTITENRQNGMSQLILRNHHNGIPQSLFLNEIIIHKVILSNRISDRSSFLGSPVILSLFNLHGNSNSLLKQILIPGIIRYDSTIGILDNRYRPDKCLHLISTIDNLMRIVHILSQKIGELDNFIMDFLGNTVTISPHFIQLTENGNEQRSDIVVVAELIEIILIIKSIKLKLRQLR